MNSISQKEWRAIFIISIVLIVITSIPYFLGYVSQDSNWEYSGRHLLAPGDISVYLSYIQQFKQGHFLFRDLFTGESINHNLINTFWIFPGIFARYFYVPPLLAFHMARAISIFVLSASIYFLLGVYFSAAKIRIYSFIFLVFSTGISGIIQPVFNLFAYEAEGYYHYPMDLWVAESNTFMTMLHSGHMALSLALLVFIFYFALRFLYSNKFIYSALSGIFTLFLLSFHPFLLPIILSALATYLLADFFINKKFNYSFFGHLFFTLFFSLPLLIYYYLMLKFDYVTIMRSLQNSAYTPAWYYLLFSYGFVLLFGFVGLRYLIKSKKYSEKKYSFLICWFVSQAFLIYAPLNFQRRMVEGLQIPLSILALVGIGAISALYLAKFKNNPLSFILKNKLALFFVFVMMFGFSNLNILGADIFLPLEKSRQIFDPAPESRAIVWLGENSAADSLILSYFMPTGNIIPGKTGRQVFGGHYVETIDYYSKEMVAKWFFSENGADIQKKKFLRDNRISHIYWGEYEQLGLADVGSFDFLTEIYSQEGIKIFAVNYD